MNQKDLKLLIRSFDDELPAVEKVLLDEALGRSAELRAEHQRLLALRSKMAAGANVAFKPFFSGRVLARLHPEQIRSRAEDFALNLTLAFRRVAFAGSLAVIALTAYNLLTGPAAADVSFVEALLGLSPVTVDTALALDLP